jgi:signal transduction histidine kinase
MSDKIISYFRFNFFLFLAIASLLVSVVVKVFFVESNAYGSFLRQVSENVREELDLTEAFAGELSTKLKNPDFFENPFALQYPNTTLIFRKGNLIFWSDNQFLVNFEQTEAIDGVSCLDSRHGVMLVYHQKVNDSTDVACVIPVYEKYNIENAYIKSSPNKKFFPDEKVSITNVKEGNYHVTDKRGVYLFSVIFPENYRYYSWHQYIVVFFALLAFVFLYFEFRAVILDLLGKNQFLKAFWLITLSLTGLRGVMLMFNLPHNLTEIGIFDSDFFPNSVISPSLGDLLLNELSLLVIVGYSFLYLRQFLREKEFNFPPAGRILVAAVLVFLGFLMMSHLFDLVKNMYQSPQIILDITMRTDEELFRLSGYVVVLSGALSYFLLVHIAAEILGKTGITNAQLQAVQIVCAFFALLIFKDRFEIVLLHFAYATVITNTRLTPFLRQISALTFVYIFIGAFFSAAAVTLAISESEDLRELHRKENLSEYLLAENDFVAENILNSVVERIPNDPLMLSRLYSPYAPKEIVEKKIKRFYLGNYFDKYDVKIYQFSGANLPQSVASEPYDSLVSRFARPEYRTNFKSIFFINDAFKNQKTYFTFIEIEKYEQIVGKLVIELRLKKFVPNSIFPNLLLDKKFNPIISLENMSYAVYFDGKLLNSYGEYAYEGKLQEKFGKEKEISEDGYRHLMIKDVSGRKIVLLSSKENVLLRLVSNLSLMLLLSLISFTTAVALYRFYFRRDHFFYGFAVRLQIYLNAAFFLPLVITSLIVVSILNKQNKDEIVREHYEKAENAAANIVTELNEFVNISEGSRDRLIDALIAVARLTQIDVNLFDKQGRLIISSQQELFDNNLLEPYINPSAAAAITAQKQKKVITEEKIGKLKYRSAYVALNSFETGELLGILSVPFFEAKSRSDIQIRAVLVSILNFFTLVLIVLSVLAYWVSKLLTEPISMLTERLRQISLSDHNEPLSYHSEDEIGLLVEGYNNMLVKLEESKNALAQNEKETAWREMAKQVAHEIKNPLTPMRLTLQHLERVTSGEANPMAKRSVETLLRQIDTLADIANSFAAFAKMPIPVEEIFDVGKVLDQIVQLYTAEKGHVLEFSRQEGQFFIKGDSKLIGRIFTNLIINAFQAIPENVYPDVRVALEKVSKDFVRVSISDNGTGIDDKIAQKVFLPNFTTKGTGSGIGLAVAKRGIEHAGGRIWFETELGIGTTFFVEIPLEKN